MFKSKLIKGILLGAHKDYQLYKGWYYRYKVVLVDDSKVVTVKQFFSYLPDGGWVPYQRVIVERKLGLFGYKYDVLCPLKENTESGELIASDTDNKRKTDLTNS